MMFSAVQFASILLRNFAYKFISEIGLQLCVCVCVCVVLGIEPRILHLLGKCSTTSATHQAQIVTQAALQLVILIFIFFYQ
jgi:hypothetical protein